MTHDERWLVRYNEVIGFLEREHRKPSKYYPEEKLMFHFIHHNKKLYNAGSMKAERVEMFEKLPFAYTDKEVVYINDLFRKMYPGNFC